MGAEELLAEAALVAAQAGLPEWRFEAGRIERSVRCRDFSEAFGVMCRIALLAEKVGHHPDWRNSYDRIELSLTTHDSGGVTQRDIDLARGIDLIFG